MLRASVCVSLLTALAAVPALADRPVTPEEQVKLVAALHSAGCTGGRMKVDDRKFEVENAVCNDGKIYELKFDASYNLIEKELDD